MSAARRIGILAGGGTLPREIADSVAARGIPLHIVALDGEADADFGPYPVTHVNWGEIGRMVETLKETGCTDLVIIGSVTRPDLATIKPDMGFVRALATVAGLVLAGGDDSVLRGVIRFFEGHGLRVVGPAEIAPELVIVAGHFTADVPSASFLVDARKGFEIVAQLGRFDIGQAAVVTEGRLEALEAAEGTDRMLERLAAQRRARGQSLATAAGVLVKRTKPAQDNRIDLPVIGPQTVTRAVECGLAGVGVEAGRVLAADRNELISRAQASRIAIAGVELTRENASGRVDEPRRVSWTGRLLHALKARRSARQLDLKALGRRPVPARILRDVKTALDAMDALRPMGGTRAVVVVRGHVLAVETGEGVSVALGRAAGLRQWGDRRLRRKAGAVVIDAGRNCAPELIALVAEGRFAGLVVKLRRFTAGVPADTIAAADKAGVFIVGVSADAESADE
jgi:DUF1009 family protein